MRGGWDFRSLGRGGVDFEAIIRPLNDIGYDGPLSVEWEDSGGARARRQRIVRVRGRSSIWPSRIAFDAAFEKKAYSVRTLPLPSDVRGAGG